MSKLLTWIKVGRIHTASLTIPALIIGHLTAGGELFSWTTFFWGIMGLLFHFFGFLQNNYYDLKYDREDPNKKHFPMVTGEIKKEHVQKLLWLGWIIVPVYGFWMSQNIGFVFLVGSMITGYIYNKVSKTRISSPIWICLSFSLLYVFAHISSGGEPNMLMFGIFGYALFQMAFQIAFSGYLKDIENKSQQNLLIDLGARLENGIYKANNSTHFGHMLRIGIFIPLIFIIQGWWQLIGAGILFVIAQIIAIKMIHTHKWDRKKDLKRMTTVEVLTYFSLLFAIGDSIGIEGIIVLIIFPFVWFVTWNKIIWNTLFAPKV